MHYIRTSTITVRLPLKVLHEIERLSEVTKPRPSVLSAYNFEQFSNPGKNTAVILIFFAWKGKDYHQMNRTRSNHLFQVEV